MVLITSTETMRLIRDGEKWGEVRGMDRGGGRGILYTCRYTVTTRMVPALRWAAMRTIFNVSVGSDGQSHTNHNLFEEKGQPKRYRTEVLPLTNLTPYR